MIQQPSFIGLIQGKCQPTDIDFMKIIDNILILIEMKNAGYKMDYGQRLILERIADRWLDKGGKSIILFMEHRVPSIETITTTDLRLKEYRVNKKWKKPKLGNLNLDMVMEKINKIKI